ncbi:hypothetical protein CJZ35_25775, partial [Salmonella enterica subsp. enterica serovar Braenderup]
PSFFFNVSAFTELYSWCIVVSVCCVLESSFHRIFTRYHTEIKREKRKVNSVNNQIKKNFFLPV